MTGQRRGYVIALVLAVLALVVSVGAVVAVVAGGSGWYGGAAAVAGQESWRQGLGGAGMMGWGHHGAGVMGDWDEQGTGSITAEQARSTAEAWATANQPGATVGEAARMPMGYLFRVTRDGTAVGTVMVNDDTGAVGWWGNPQPDPTSSAS